VPGCLPPLGIYCDRYGLDRALRWATWTLYGQICTADSASIPAGNLVSLTAFTVIYILLLIAYLFFSSRIIRRGPKFDLPVLGVEPTKPAVNTTPESSFPTSAPYNSRGEL